MCHSDSVENILLRSGDIFANASIFYTSFDLLTKHYNKLNKNLCKKYKAINNNHEKMSA